MIFAYIKKFLAFAEDQRGNMAAALGLGFLQSLFNAASLVATAFVPNAIIEGSVSVATAWGAAAIIAFGMDGAFVCSYFSTQLRTKAGYTVEEQSRIRVADRLRYAPMGYFSKRNLGQIANTATNVAEGLQESLTRCMLLAVQGLLTTVALAVFIALFDWRFGLIALAGFALFLSVNNLLHKAGERLSEKKVEATENAVEAILEYVQGIVVIKSYNLVVGANRKVSEAIAEDRDVALRLEKAFAPIMSAQELVTRLAILSIIIFAIVFSLNGSMRLGDALVMCIASFMVFESLNKGGHMSALLRVAALSIDNIKAALDMPSMGEDGADISAESKDIEAADVFFSYGDRPVIKGVTVEVPQGLSLAIVGGSGSGKTTLCNLMARFWDVDEGRIALGGRDVRDYSTDSLIKNYSMVFQNVYLFNDTVASNTRFGKPDATMEEIRDSAAKASCNEFIAGLPDGYGTVIGEGGASLSGGEKQRISITRAIIKDNPIVILDEATANVDPENEWLLQKAIQELTESKTVIMVAHRLKTVRHADHIIVLEKGAICQQGTHESLLKQGGRYAQFVNARERSAGWKFGERDLYKRK